MSRSPIAPAPATTTPSPSSTPSGSPAATAVVSLAGVDLDGGNVSIAGYVSGVIEEGGTCTFTLTPDSGAAPVTVSTTGIENVRTTSCGTAQVPIDRFARGGWSATLAYSSPANTLTSAPLKLEIA